MSGFTYASAGFPYAPAPAASPTPSYGGLGKTTTYYPTGVYQSRYDQPWSTTQQATSLHSAWIHVLGAAGFVFLLAFIAGSYPPAKPVAILVLLGAFAVYLITGGGAQKLSAFTANYL